MGRPQQIHYTGDPTVEIRSYLTDKPNSADVSMVDVDAPAFACKSLKIVGFPLTVTFQ